MATYAHENFEQIANVIDKEVAEIAQQAELFESAARWYRLDRNRPSRTAPSSLCRKLDQIANSARRLLKNLGVNDANEAADGHGDSEILDAMILSGERDDRPVVKAIQRIGRLVEIIEAASAAAELSRRANEAAEKVSEVGELTVEKGNSGDVAINDWIAAMMSVYRIITGKEPATSVRAPNQPNEGIAGGPFIRFLAAAGKPLELAFSEDAWRSRVRTVQKSATQD